MDPKQVPISWRQALPDLEDQSPAAFDGARRLLADLSLPQLRLFRRPRHHRGPARPPDPVAPPSATGDAILEATVRVLTHAFVAGDRPAPHAALTILGAFLHPRIHLDDYWHRERELVARLDRWTLEDVRGLLDAMPEEDRQRCILEADPVPWAHLAACPTPDVMQHAVASVVEWTHKPVYSTEQEVAARIAELGGGVRPYLVRALCHGRPKFRHVLLDALRQVNHQEAIPAYLAALTDSRQDNVNVAQEALAALGPLAHGPLADHLSHRQQKQRLAAARCLRRLEPAKAIADIARHAIETESDPDVLAELHTLLEQEPPSAGKAEWSQVAGTLFDDERTETLRTIFQPYLPHPISVEEAASTSRDLLVYSAGALPSSAPPPLVRAWERVLRAYATDPVAPWAAASGFSRLGRANRNAEGHLEMLEEIFGDSLVEPFVDLLTTEPPPQKGLLLSWLGGRSAGPPSLFAEFLTDKSEGVRDAAERGLVASGEGALEATWPALRARRKDTRTSAARVLRRLRFERSVEPLKEALAREKDADVAEALQNALDACAGGREGPEPRRQEVYDPDAPVTESDLLSALRGACYSPDDDDSAAWVEVCDILDRMHALGVEAVGLEYVSSQDFAARRTLGAPRSWRGRAALEQLGATEAADGAWTTVHSLFAGSGPSWIAEVAPGIETKRSKARLLEPPMAEIFVATLRGAWRFCAKHGLPLAALELRVDGGSAKRGILGKPKTTSLELFHRYGAIVRRDNALIEGDGRPAGLRFVRVTVPEGHPARDRFNMGRKEQSLDLIEHIGSQVS